MAPGGAGTADDDEGTTGAAASPFDALSLDAGPRGGCCCCGCGCCFPDACRKRAPMPPPATGAPPGLGRFADLGPPKEEEEEEEAPPDDAARGSSDDGAGTDAG